MLKSGLQHRTAGRWHSLGRDHTADTARLEQLTSWEAVLELAAINAPHGFMIYQASVPQFAH